MLQPFAKNLSFNAPVVFAFHRAGWQASVHISFQEDLQIDIMPKADCFCDCM